MLTDPHWRQLGATLAPFFAPFFALIILAGFALLLARGRTFLLAYARAPIGIGIPATMLLVFAALPQMRGMMIATLGGYTDGVYGTSAWHQVPLPLAVFALGLQGWFWTRATLNAVDRRTDDALGDPPSGETWAIRVIFLASAVLGVVPAFIVGGLHWLAAPNIPWWSVALSLIGSAVLYGLVHWRRRVIRSRPRVRSAVSMPASLTARLFLCAPGGRRFAVAAIAYAAVGIALAEAAPDWLDRTLNTPTAALLGASSYVPAATLLLTLWRDAAAWVLARLGAPGASPQAATLGFLLFVLTPFAGSGLAIHTGFYDVRTIPPGAAPAPAACPDQPRPIFLALAGGASRAAAWGLSAMRMLDIASEGEFSRNLHAISSVSGGSLAAVTYAAARKQKSFTTTDDPGFLATATDLAHADLLPATAARLFSVDLLLGLPTRGRALANGFETFWTRNGTVAAGNTTLADIDTSCTPQLILNGVAVDSGRRLLTGNRPLPPGRFAGAQDLRDTLRPPGGEPPAFPLSAAVLNSARFPVVSPPGILHYRLPPTGDAPARPTLLQVVDGGFYENSGLATALELAEAEAADHPGLAGSQVMVVVHNLASRYRAGAPVPRPGSTVPAGGPGALDACSPLPWLESPDPAATSLPPDPELLTSALAINGTRNTRFLATLAQARARFCAPGNNRLFLLDLPEPEDPSTQPVPLNWVLTPTDCEFMFGSARLTPLNLDNAVRLANLLHPGRDPLRAETLAEALERREDKAGCKGRRPTPP